MSTSRMEMNGRIVVPKAIRKALGARLGTRFTWELQEDGSIRVTARSRRLTEADQTSLPPEGESTAQSKEFEE